MNSKSAYFEKYSVAPSPSRNYYGIKVFRDEVILYIWRISHGPHLSPIVRVIKFPDFNGDKLLKDEILHVFGSNVLKYLELVTTERTKSLLTLPKDIIEKLIKYLSLKDFANLFCVSPICDEILNKNSYWEIFYKRLRKSSKLSDMEKELGTTHGFKKLVNDHQIRNAARKTIKAMEDKSARSQGATGKNEKMIHTTTVNPPKSILVSDVKHLTRRLSIDDSSRKIQKPMKSPKFSTDTKEKKFNLPKKSASEEKSSILINSHKTHEKHAAGEGYRKLKLMNPLLTKNKSEHKIDRAGETKIVNKDKEKSELILQKKLKSSIMQTDFSDTGSEDCKVKTIRSPRSIFTKHSNHALGEIKSKSSDKIEEQKKSKSLKKKTSSTAKLDLKNLISEHKNSDSDDSGMSYLMKRYLQASDEVARKFSECERLAHSTKNSSIQVDMKEKPERKPLKKILKHAVATERPVSRSPGSTTNIFTKLKSFKKN